VTIESRRFDARSDHGGTIEVQGASVHVSPLASLLAGGRLDGGSLCFQASAGDMTLDGNFDGTGPGCVIDGSASGNLTADGRFKCAPSGCVGLSAGGTLSATGSFDTPVSASCPCP